MPRKAAAIPPALPVSFVCCPSGKYRLLVSARAGSGSVLLRKEHQARPAGLTCHYRELHSHASWSRDQLKFLGLGSADPHNVNILKYYGEISFIKGTCKGYSDYVLGLKDPLGEDLAIVPAMSSGVPCRRGTCSREGEGPGHLHNQSSALPSLYGVGEFLAGQSATADATLRQAPAESCAKGEPTTLSLGQGRSCEHP